MPIDQYSGGITHAVMHLIYARFFQKVLMDMGMTKDPEPFPALLNQGMVTMGGKAMSKSRGNIVEPIEAFEKYGADALRLYMLFSGPPEQDFDWPPEGVDAIGPTTYSWLQRVWRFFAENASASTSSDSPLTAEDEALRKHVHRTIRVVTDDYERFSFNTAVARMMELVNEGYRYRAAGGSNQVVLGELMEALVKLLAPMAPYVSEDLWERLGHEGTIHHAAWPTFDPDLASEEEVTMVVQVNGKVRDTITVPASIDEAAMLERALGSEKVQGYLNGGEPRKVIARPPKLLSLVI
jgi:leucyl-tRNA synthetase